jgi:hypothetical protein
MEQTIQATLEMEAAYCSETLITFYQMHDITSQKTLFSISDFVDYLNFFFGCDRTYLSAVSAIVGPSGAGFLTENTVKPVLNGPLIKRNFS